MKNIVTILILVETSLQYDFYLLWLCFKDVTILILVETSLQWY